MSEKRLGMLIDLSLCIGCNACAVACKLENDVPANDVFNVWVESWDGDRGDGYVCRTNVPKQCNQCTNPSCVPVCPTGATYIAEDGTVQINADECIGCQACMAACPYGARSYNEDLNVVEKCTCCVQRLKDGESPACVHNCSCGARFYGDLDDPESDAAKAVAAAGEDACHQLPDANGAAPRTVYILSPKTAAWKEIG